MAKMAKKEIIIIILLVAAIGGFFIYKNFSNPAAKTVAGNDSAVKKLLVFDIKNNNLPADKLVTYQGQFEQLKADLQQNPDTFNKWMSLGVLKKTVNDFEGARDIWLYGAKIRPQSSAPWSSLGDLYANFLNDPTKAEAAWKKAIELEPTDYTFYIALAELYRYKISGDEALYEPTLLDTLAKFPDNPNVISYLATYYRQTKQTQKAIQYYEQLVRLDPANQTAKDDLAELKVGTK